MTGRQNITRGGGASHRSPANVPRPGSYESTYSWMFPQYEGESASQKARVQSPSVSFRTERPPFKTFLYVLRILSKTHFGHALQFDGPPLGLSDTRKELVGMDAVINAMERIEDAPVPLLGFRALLVYDHESRIRAKVKVSGGGPAKVKVKIKGPVFKADWALLKKRLGKRFSVDL